jgi:HEPN domain-containing protein
MADKKAHLFPPEAWWPFVAEDLLSAADFVMLGHEYSAGHCLVLCQQAIEKSFKAFLAWHKIAAPYSHDLEMLYQMVQQVKDFDFDTVLLDRLFRTYIDTRYPVGLAFDDAKPTMADAKIYLDFAKTVVQKIAAEIGQPFPEATP